MSREEDRKVHLVVGESRKRAWQAEASRRGMSLSEWNRHCCDREIDRIAATPIMQLGSSHCSFCGKGQQEVVRLIVAPAGSAFICNECVNVCSGLIAGDRAAEPPPANLEAR